jgi:ABC-type glycerol-3-phosphate transport system substrate-binding protein
MSTITKMFIAALAGVALMLPLASMGVPYGMQQSINQKAQEAKKELAAAQAATGPERQKMMERHMKMMDDIIAQMQKAKPGTNMTPEQMREWIDEHLKLMNEMMGQMMEEHHMMMQDMGMPGMGKK